MRGFAFEWLVEARDGRAASSELIHSGFGTGEDWDGQYNGMLRRLEAVPHQPQAPPRTLQGRDGDGCAPGGDVADDPSRGLGRPDRPPRNTGAPQLSNGSRVTSPGAPPLAGVVVDVADWRIALLLDEPSRGTAFIAAEDAGDQATISIWSYLYGDKGSAAAERDRPAWQTWLDESSPETAPDQPTDQGADVRARDQGDRPRS